MIRYGPARVRRAGVCYDTDDRGIGWLVVAGVSGRRARWPVRQWDYTDVSIRTRAATVPFENRWQLSVIWGGGTYSSNHDYHGVIPGWRETENQPFIEAPATVEVGVLCPEPIKLPPLMTPDSAEMMAEHSPAFRAALDSAEGRSWLFDERDTTLWGDPLGYLSADDLLAVADVVGRLPSHPGDKLAGAEFYDLDGFMATAAERFGVSRP